MRLFVTVASSSRVCGTACLSHACRVVSRRVVSYRALGCADGASSDTRCSEQSDRAQNGKVHSYTKRSLHYSEARSVRLLPMRRAAPAALEARELCFEACPLCRGDERGFLFLDGRAPSAAAHGRGTLRPERLGHRRQVVHMEDAVRAADGLDASALGGGGRSPEVERDGGYVLSVGGRHARVRQEGVLADVLRGLGLELLNMARAAR